MDAGEIPTTLPDRIRDRLERLNAEIGQIISHASEGLTIALPPVTFTYRHAATGDILTPFERAQSVSFITRYEQLPTECTVRIIEREGEHQIQNMGFLRHALNDWRPLIQLQKDPVYYQNVHSAWLKALARKDPRAGLCVTASDEKGSDVTDLVVACLGERNRAIKAALQPLEYDYLYNGILQHSDDGYSVRFLEDYTSGELNYVLWKHVHVLGFVYDQLELLYGPASTLTFPKLGPL